MRPAQIAATRLRQNPDFERLLKPFEVLCSDWQKFAFTEEKYRASIRRPAPAGDVPADRHETGRGCDGRGSLQTMLARSGR
jgi:hypothetical protein